MKRCLPDLKIPQQYRCESCIDGKIHMFGHKACKEGERTEYPPGTYIDTDHSGPYARSLSGARYSQLYLDRGSGYLWGARQHRKVEHYISTPKIFVDSWGLSGRKVQILRTDGDTVFGSVETREMLEAHQVRHEYSAPYDSNTNPFVERARRTVFEGVCTALLRSGAPARFWGEAECHKIYTINNLPTQPDPDKPGAFCSRRNLLEGSRRPFNLERLMAFGTAATCYVPKEQRKGGKEPAQRRSFHAVILGYEEVMPAYRVWDLETRRIKLVSYNFTICHEGYYPFRDKINWPAEFMDDPENFSPLFGGVLTLPQFKRFEFDAEEAEEVMSKAPDLIVSRPDPELKTHAIAKAPEPLHVPPALTPTPAIATRPLTTLQSPAEAPTFVHPHKARDFWQEKLSSAGGTAASTHYVSLPVSQLQSRSESEEKISKALDGVPGALVEIFKVFSDPGALVELSKALVALKPASEDAKAAPGDSKALVDLSTALVDLKAAPGNYKAAVGNYKAATEKSIALAENFKASTQKRKAFTPKALSFYAKAPLMQEPNFSDPYDKPMGVPPPKTLREARLSPWWPQYKEAMQKEYDGHVKSGTWELVSKESIPKGKNILRGKWVFDDKRGNDGKITRFKARFVAMGFTQKYGVDFTETFAGVVIGKSFRISCSLY